MASLTQCPAELIDLIIKDLPLSDLQSLRLTCCKLQKDTFPTFQKTHFAQKVVDINPDDLTDLLGIAANENFNSIIQTLVIKYHDHGMRATYEYCEYDPVPTRRTFVDNFGIQLSALVQTRVFETHYFSKAIKSHSPGDLIYSPQEYQCGATLTVDMLDRLNKWMEFVRNAEWVEMLEKAIACLPNLTAIMLWDGRNDTGIPASNGYPPFVHPLLALAPTIAAPSMAIQETCLDLKLPARDIFTALEMELVMRNFAAFSSLRKLSISLSVPVVRGLYTRTRVSTPRVDCAVFRRLVNLEQIRVYRLGADPPIDRYFSFKVLDKAIRARAFPKLRLLCLERMKVYRRTLDYILRQEDGIKVLVLNQVVISDWYAREAAGPILTAISRSPTLREVWVSNISRGRKLPVMFRTKRSIDEHRFAEAASKYDPAAMASAQAEILKRRECEHTIIKLMSEAGKTLCWGKPEGCVGTVFHGLSSSKNVVRVRKDPWTFERPESDDQEAMQLEGVAQHNAGEMDRDEAESDIDMEQEDHDTPYRPSSLTDRSRSSMGGVGSARFRP